MLKLDEFESVFKSASKARFERQDVALESGLVLTDLDAESARRFGKDIEDALGQTEVRWHTVGGEAFDDVGDVLELIENHRPDLIAVYRNLHGQARNFPFSLGSHVDVLTQATTTPILLLPAPLDGGRLNVSFFTVNRVMVLTDHLTGSDLLVSWGAAVTPRDGHLFLTHLEDDAVFERYLGVIAKIPGIDTEEARESISRQLLKEPHDYIVDCSEQLSSADLGFETHELVRMGHRVSDCQKLLAEHEIDLLVMNTKDEEQLAMHGLAYPLTIELRDHALLLL